MFEFILILTEKLALLDDDDPNLADSLDEPYLSRIGYEIFKYRGINSRDGKPGGVDERLKCHNPTGIRMLNTSLNLGHSASGQQQPEID